MTQIRMEGFTSSNTKDKGSEDDHAMEVIGDEKFITVGGANRKEDTGIVKDSLEAKDSDNDKPNPLYLKKYYISGKCCQCF